MKGDFSRDTFDPKKHYLRVLMQQGRVQVDADWNEQASILLHYMQSLARDIIGPYGKPENDFVVFADSDLQNFKEKRATRSTDNSWKDQLNPIWKNFPVLIDKLDALLEEDPKKMDGIGKSFLISPGHYYVDGLLCENEDWIAYEDQPGGPLTDISKLNRMLVYLDVWERHVAWCEEASNSMREAALGPYGPDTATRSQLVWQVRIYELENNDPIFITAISGDGGKSNVDFEKFKNETISGNRGRLSAMVQEQSGSGDERCAANPSGKYLGLENQLYRVEIHQPAESADGPTFKWSRDNGSLVFPVIEGKIRFPSDENGKKMYVELAHLGLDESKALKKGDWVEFVHESYVLQNRAESLLQVEDIDHQTMEVTLVTKGELLDTSKARLPILRRWDQCENKNSDIGPEGDIPIKPDWIELEDGIQIKFEEHEDNFQIVGTTTTILKWQHYRTGDYWLIPARAATKNIEWPIETEGVPRHGIEHHYAPLAVLKKEDGTWKIDTSYDYNIFDIKNLPNC